MQCPQCGGECYDNKARKASGKMKANAPDFACKDKEGCGWKKWPPKDQAAPRGPSRSGPSLTWTELRARYLKCRDIAVNAWQADPVAKDASAIVAATAALFIECNKANLSSVPPAPKPPPPPPESEYDDEPPYDDLGDEVPF